VREGPFGHSRYLTGYLLIAYLGFPCFHFKLFYVYGCINILFYKPFGYDYGVLKVVSPPRHKGYQHILSKGKLTPFGGLAIGQEVSLFDFLSFYHQGSLVYTGILVCSLKLFKLIYINPYVRWVCEVYLLWVNPYYYPL